MRKKIIINNKETNYSVSDDGHVFNDKTGRELKGTYSTNEYHSIQLVIEGKPKTFMVHRLVAEAFCENPNNYTIVDHIDRNKHNDHASNLRWVTAKENAENKGSLTRTVNKKYNKDSFDEQEWTTVFQHEGFMIKKDGTVVNQKTKNILIPQDRHGYKRVNFHNKRLSLHILVWESFNKQKVPEGFEIDHIDGNKGNNNLSNLRLVNHKENMLNAYNNNHSGKVAVKQYTLDGQYLKTYPSIREAAFSVNALEAGLKEATNRHGSCAGYYWIRENDTITIEEIMYGWIPEGYALICDYPTYCINKDGDVYNKRTKKHTPFKYRADGKTKYVVLNGKRINIENLMP